MTNNDEPVVLRSAPEPEPLAVVDSPLLERFPANRPTRTSPKRAARRTPQKVRATQPGDPACWAWQPFHFGREPLSVESAVRALRAWHKGRCGICGEVPRLLVVDHDHNTALVRGMLCDDCNLQEGVARVKDDAFARWRAVPSAAILGIVVVYASQQSGVADPMPYKVTGPPFLPEWAPPHHPWPPRGAMTVDQPPGYASRPRREPPSSDASPEPPQWPVQVGEEVALGLREHMQGVAECRLGVVEALSTFGIRLRMWTKGREWSQTIRWQAIEEIVHAPMMNAESLEECGYLPDAQEIDTSSLYTAAYEWSLSPVVRRQDHERHRAAMRERRLIRAGHNFPGYL